MNLEHSVSTSCVSGPNRDTRRVTEPLLLSSEFIGQDCLGGKWQKVELA